METPFHILYNSERNYDVHLYNRSFLAGLADQELVQNYSRLQNKVIELCHLPQLQTYDNRRYLDDLIRIIIRSGQSSRILRDCFDEKSLAANGVFPVLKKNFGEFGEEDFKFFDMECNQPGRRFAPQLEYDLLITSMLLLMESTFMRTPTSISFYLCFTSNRIILHLLDNDETESNLHLNVIPKEEWPVCYALAAHIAGEYNGKMTIDPTITRGISVEVVFSLPDHSQWIIHRDS